MRKNKAFAAVAAAALALGVTACSQGGSSATTGAANNPNGQVQSGTGAKPAPFDKGQVRVAIVQNTGQGDYFQQYLNGTKKQAEALDMKLDVYDAQGDNATQASQLDQAIASGVQGIIVRHGFADTLCPGVNKALDQGIKVVIYDVEIQKCAPRAIQTQQSDAKMASLVLDQMKKDLGGTAASVGYVNVAGIAPLDRRDAVWQQYKADNSWTEKFKTGKYTPSTATDSAPMVDNALKANQDVKAIYAPYDEFTKSALSALEQNPSLKDKVFIYGADISTADIALMVADGSPWKATGATDPNAIGAAVTRTLALDLANELKTKNVEFPPILVTQAMLREKNIKNMDDLRKNEPSLNISDVSTAAWMPKVTF